MLGQGHTSRVVATQASTLIYRRLDQYSLVMSTERPSKRKELPDVLPEDPKERKRIQNRIAQRKYREYHWQ